ncbi:MAG: SirB2 family protein, partial [Proteobacteria bacterium]|nr:SirB2 family protein [Pseudomonadota bacterium]
MKSFHIILAYLTVIGFVIRAFWSLTASTMLSQKWVRIVPHVVDTLLLVLGVSMAISLSLSPVAGWLGAKLIGLVCYIGFGVLTMRAQTTSLKIAGLIGALLSVGYIFAVAFSRAVWPF